MDLISNMISIIKNGYNLKLTKVEIMNSKICLNILLILYRLGFIKGYLIKNKKTIIIFLKYINNKPVIRNIVRISSPGKRIYMNIKKFKYHLKKKSNGFYIFSTSKGLLTDEEVLFFNIGGEVLLKVN